MGVRTWGRRLWVAVYFADSVDPCGEGHGVVKRWRRAGIVRGVAGEEGLREALARLSGAPPEGLSNPLEGVPLDLLSAREEDGVLTLDFSEGLGRTTRTGSVGCMRDDCCNG